MGPVAPPKRTAKELNVGGDQDTNVISLSFIVYTSTD